VREGASEGTGIRINRYQCQAGALQKLPASLHPLSLFFNSLGFIRSVPDGNEGG
jgi:hypothetical protein